jgi:hypothetical protein
MSKSAAASEDGEGRIRISLTNTDLKNEHEVKIEPRGMTVSPPLKARNLDRGNGGPYTFSPVRIIREEQ